MVKTMKSCFMTQNIRNVWNLKEGLIFFACLLRKSPFQNGGIIYIRDGKSTGGIGQKSA